MVYEFSQADPQVARLPLTLPLDYQRYWDADRNGWTLPTPFTSCTQSVVLYINSERQDRRRYKLSSGFIEWKSRELPKSSDKVTVDITLTLGARLSPFQQKLVLAAVSIIPALLTFSVTTFFASRWSDLESVVKIALSKELDTRFQCSVTRTIDKVFESVSNDISDAHESVNIVSWKHVGKLKDDKAIQRVFEKTKSRVTDTAMPRIAIRRLFWDPTHLNVIDSWKTTYGALRDVEIRYLPKNVLGPRDVAGCVIVDRRILHFGLGFPGTPQINEDTDIRIESKDAAGMFDAYFNSLWERATVVKSAEATCIDELVLKDLRAKEK